MIQKRNLSALSRSVFRRPDRRQPGQPGRDRRAVQITKIGRASCRERV